MKKFIFILCAAFLTFALVLGFITYNKTTQALLSVNIEALTNNENEGTSSNEGTSNNEGNGTIFFYTHKLGDPKTCTLYRHIDLNGGIHYSNGKAEGNLGWTNERLSGIEESCPNTGAGCTVFSCQEVHW